MKKKYFLNSKKIKNYEMLKIKNGSKKIISWTNQKSKNIGKLQIDCRRRISQLKNSKTSQRGWQLPLKTSARYIVRLRH